MMLRPMIAVAVTAFVLLGAGVAIAHTHDYGPGDNYDPGHDGHVDTLDGGGGRDDIYGQGHNDVLRGGDDQDWISGDGSNDDTHGGDGNDAVIGGGGDDDVDGGPGADDYVIGGTTSDSGLGDDRVLGDNANDRVMAAGDNGGSPDVVRGEEGYDTCYIDNGQETAVTSCEVTF